MKPLTANIALLLLLCCVSPASEAASAGPTLRDCRDCPELVVVPGGEFLMGSPASEPGRDTMEGPQRRVRIKSFALGKFHVTRGQRATFATATQRPSAGGCAWSALPGGEPDELKIDASWRHLGFEQNDDHPAVCISWQDAQDYVRWMSRRTGHTYQLLSEAQWEYAARAGTTTPHPWGSEPSHEHANHGADDCCSGLAVGRDRWVHTSPVGSFAPNAFGLYDMHGNAMQWTQDCLASSYTDLPTDGSANSKDSTLAFSGDFAIFNGTSACAYRMLRGGDWGNPASMIRSAARNFAPPPGATLQNYRSAGLGFRVARALDQ